MMDFTHEPPPGFLRLFWARGALLPLSLSVVLVLISLFISYDIRMAVNMRAVGEEVQGEVVARETRNIPVRDRIRRVHFVTMRYSAYGRPMETTQAVSLELFEASPPGMIRNVRFLPERPEIVEVYVGQFWDAGRRWQILPLVVGLLAIALLVVRGRAIVPAYEARLYGQAEVGHIIGVARHRGRHALVWRDGRGLVGESLPSGPERYRRYDPGQKITLYRGRDGRAWWTGDVGSRNFSKAAKPVKRPV